MKRFKRLKKLGVVCLVAILTSMNTMSVFADEVITTPVICDDEELIDTIYKIFLERHKDEFE